MRSLLKQGDESGSGFFGKYVVERSTDSRQDGFSSKHEQNVVELTLWTRFLQLSELRL